MTESGSRYNKQVFGLKLRILVLRPHREKAESQPRGHETQRWRALPPIRAWDEMNRCSSSYSIHLVQRGLACVLMALVFCGAIFAQQPNPHQIFDAALAAQRRGDEALAVSKYRQVIHLRPDLTAAHANLAGALVALGRFNEAIAEYRTALTEVPGNPALELNLAIAYFKKGDTVSAAGLLSALHAADSTNERVAILLGGCDVRLGQDAQAITLLTPFEANNGDNLDLEFALGSALLAAGHTSDGLQRVEKVAQQGRRAEAYLLAAQADLKLDQFNQARQDVQAAMRLNPSLPGLDTVDGRVLDYFGDQKGAAAAYQKALKANPNDFEAELQLGAVLYTERQLDAAREHLVRALEMQPASAPAHYEMGRVERAQGKLDAAAGDLEKAEQEDPGWLEPHVELTAIYYRLKRPSDGAREKAIVDRIKAEQQQRGTQSRIITPGAP